MLTDAKVRTAKATDKPYKLTDAGGLYLHVMPAGSRVWRYRYEIAGREKVLTIGHYPAVGLADARSKRDAAKAIRREGQDPVMARRVKVAQVAAEQEDTFERISREWYGKHRHTWRERHADDVIHSLERDVFPTLGQLPIRTITVPVTLACLRAIEERGAVETARRMRQRVSAVFVFAIASGRADFDPAAIVKGALSPITRSHQPAVIDLLQLRKVLTGAEAIPAQPGTRLALRLLALTACRPGELRGAVRSEFEELEGQSPVWRIPAERMKGRQGKRREHVIPLSVQAAEVASLAIRLIGRGTLVFPSVRHAHKPLSENAIGYLLNRAGYHGQHVPHGFRAAFSSIMNEHHPELSKVIDGMLAHAPKDKVEAAYNRARHFDLRRQLAQEWADLLLEGIEPAASLLDLPRR